MHRLWTPQLHDPLLRSCTGCGPPCGTDAWPAMNLCMKGLTKGLTDKGTAVQASTDITGIQNECIEGHSAIPTFSNPCKKDVVIADARAISVKFDKPGKRCRHIATGSIICMPIALLTDPYCRLLGARILQLGTDAFTNDD